METISFTYNWPLVFLSIGVAVFSAFVALDISTRLAVSGRKTRNRWIFAGALVLGLGIWAMHFIAMLAFHLSMDVTYNVAIVLLSILPALVSCWIAFYIISRSLNSWKSLLIGAFFIGTGIISMHYIGMEAMQMGADITYDPLLWGLSAVIAFATSLAALYLLFQLRDLSGFHWRKIGSAVLMGLAVAGMHYTGMAAATFVHMGSHVHGGASSVNSTVLGYAVGLGTLLILSLAYNSVRADRRMATQTDESELKFHSVIESANDAIIVADHTGHIIQWNQGAARIFGYPKEEVLGRSLQLIIPERFRQLHQDGIARYYKSRKPHVIGKTLELEGLRKDGSEFPIELSLGTWETEEGLFFSSIIRDITERKLTEERISSLVYLDPLTSLPNRRLFNDRLESTLARSAEDGQSFSLLYLDIDHFKLVNDMLGHAGGDQLLMEVTDRLQGQIAEKDTLSRLGGDEFIFLLPWTDHNQAAEYAQRILDSFRQPFRLNGEELFVTPSVGISLYPSDGQDAETLIKNADIALYRVKEEGKNSFQFFTNKMDDEVARRSKIAIGLRKGLERGEFTIHYQPQIDIKSGGIIGVEALVRWVHPHMGPISPGEFIPIAEESGTIIQLGEFVLRNACLQNKAWQDAGLPKFRMAINISARQFSQINLCELVESALNDSGLEPEYLELELTESIIQGASSAVETMKELKAMGIHLSIDDFGTGYSSLSYLKLFPINTLKIDQYFTRNIHVDVKDAALVDTIIRMAHNLELNVIAEGVETDEQLSFLKERHCNQAQGYLFNRPLPADDIQRLYGDPAPLGV
ncbi:bifunctional diguanylate cyclase/phosphodiesterase [Planococcus sp. CAU13]|uniref:bifunctional diguanylate cyclase/phosphodiesterase n=1 Tax=Planococcus sp. CAU13 TaxID=1541197 RepID=UPI0005300699|nr:bifunctional diguanylate cyclase/phosphodiesterase [Planococcus sp. CAU13]